MAAIDSIHTIGSVHVLNAAAATQFKFDSITTRSFSPGLQEIIQRGAGQPDVSYVATMTVEPMLTMTVTEIDKVLSNVGIGGLAISGSDPNNHVRAWFTKVAEGGMRAGATSHIRLLFEQGIMVTNSITWTHPGQASAEVAFHATYDGSNAIVTYTGSQSLPDTPTVDTSYVGGPIFINGVEVSGVQSITFDLGISVAKRYAKGDWRPVYASITERLLRTTIVTKEVPVLSTFTFEGTAQGGTASEIYFRKIAKHGTRVANATAEHIKITILANKGEIWCGEFGGGNNEDSQGAIIIQPTDVPTVSTTSTLPVGA